MDVTDLKGLYAEVGKRMKAALDHLQHEFAGVRTGRASVTILDNVHVEAYGSKMPLNQVAGLSIPEPDDDRRAAVRPVAARRDREGDSGGGPRPEPGQRRQGGAHPAAVADRGTAKGAVHARAQAERGRPQQRAPGAPRRQRPPQEDAQGPRPVGGRREEGPRGSPEVDRPATSSAIDDLQKKKDAELLGASNVLLHASRVLRSLRRAAARPARADHHLCVCGAPLLARYDLDDGARLVARQPEGPRAEHVAVSRADAALRRRDAGDARRRVHAADSRAHARRDARPRSRSTSRTNRSTRPIRSRRGASRRRSRGRSTWARRRLSLPSAGNAGNAAAAYAAAAGLECEVFMPEDVKRAVRRRVPALRRRRHAGRRADHRRRPHRGRKRRTARLVRRLDAQGAVPHRGQEDDGVRARRADATGAGRTGSSIRPAAAPAWSACGRPSTRSSASAGSSRRSGRAWSRCRPSTARRSSARSSKARRRRSRGRTRRRSPTVCACRARSATS